MKKHYLLASFFVIVLIFTLLYYGLFASCKNTSVEKLVIHNEHNLNDSISNQYRYSLIEEDLMFFQEMQELLKKGQYKCFVNKFINFPLEGDIIFYYCYGENVFKEGFDFYQKRLTPSVFIEKFNLIFDDQKIRLIINANFQNLLADNNYSEKIILNTNEAVTIDMIHHNGEYSLFISYEDYQESINQNSVVYVLKRFGNRLKIYNIYGIG